MFPEIWLLVGDMLGCALVASILGFGFAVVVGPFIAYSNREYSSFWREWCELLIGIPCLAGCFGLVAGLLGHMGIL